MITIARYEIPKKIPIQNAGLNCSIYAGIGDCITTKSQLLSFINQGNIINLSPNKKTIWYCKPNPEQYLNFIFSFMELIFIEPGFNLVDDIYDYKLLGYTTLLPYNEAKPINLTSQLCDKNYILDKKLIPGKYIVLHTKVRDCNPGWFDKKLILISIKKFINRFGYKLVVMGERNIGRNKEYKEPYHMENMFLIYNEIKYIFGNDFIDYTVDELGITIPSLSNIMKDCSIMSQAKFNICFGGGSVIMASSVNKIVYLAGDFMWNFFSKNAFKDTKHFVTNNLHSFINFFETDSA